RRPALFRLEMQRVTKPEPLFHGMRLTGLLALSALAWAVWTGLENRRLSDELDRQLAAPECVVRLVGMEGMAPDSVGLRLVRGARLLQPPPEPWSWTLSEPSADVALTAPSGLLDLAFADRRVPVLLQPGDAATFDLSPAPAGFARVFGGPGLASTGLILEEPRDDEGRVHDTRGFLLAEAEVSVAEFAAFRGSLQASPLDAAGFSSYCSELERTLTPDGCQGHLTQASASLWTDQIGEGTEEHPVRFVSLLDAMAYCRYIDDLSPGGARHRLPTRSEWERGARGVDGRAFPWGPEPLTPWRRGAMGRDLRVRGQPDLISPYGLFHMGSGVAEWTLTLEGERRRFVMGASFDVSADQIHLGYRVGESPFSRSPTIGFRLLRDERRP
ncbi:MAG: SUMF1/EgtB/PvdO family nonheme iron enzyme, partial [Planctomycetes bacterium]|nr:SUMF1/EgtB/PvdO family nonheme iron enzyme [Planctomycetota bacterium]